MSDYLDGAVALSAMLLVYELTQALEDATDETWPKWRLKKANKLIDKANHAIAISNERVPDKKGGA